MSDVRAILERGVGGASPPPGGFERMLRRRDRKRRNERVAAAVVGLAIAIAAVVIGAASIRSDRSAPAEPTDRWVDAGRLSDLALAGVTYLEDTQVFVIASPGAAPYALSAVSPHSPYGVAEYLKYCRPFGGFREGEHGAQFDDHGEYMTGPAGSGMFPVQTRVTSDGIVQVRPFPVAAPPPRGTDAYPNPPGICVGGTSHYVEVAPGILDRGDTPYFAPEQNLLQPPTIWFGPNDRPVTPATLSTFGTRWCDGWPPAILQLIVPLGTEPSGDTVERIYVADPEGRWADQLATPYTQEAALPPAAEFTGYRSIVDELWIDPSTFDIEVYLVRQVDGQQVVLRLPRIDDLPACEDPNP